MRRLPLALAAAGSLLSLLMACGTDNGPAADAGAEDAARPRDGAAQGDSASDPDGTAGGDAGVDGPSDAAAAFDGECLDASTAPMTGETCAGFGAGEPCEPACGLPKFGYVCFNGGPPNIAGCVQVRKSIVGETYCCPKNDCVRVPDQDNKCLNGAQPSLYQCPPTDKDGGAATPPGACTETTLPGSPYKYYCCP